MLSLNYISLAQKDNLSDTVKLRAAASELCDCMAPHINTLHPYLLEMLEVMAIKGEQAGSDTLAARLLAKPAEQAAVMKSANYMDSPEFQKSVEGCEEKLKAKYPFLDKKKESKADEEFVKSVLSRIPNCKFVHIMMVIGTKEEKD